MKMYIRCPKCGHKYGNETVQPIYIDKYYVAMVVNHKVINPAQNIYAINDTCWKCGNTFQYNHIGAFSDILMHRDDIDLKIER